jgi:hypothetical protein
MHGLTLITPTSDRPRSFAVCERWMRRAIAQLGNRPVQWIVADDGHEPLQPTMGQLHLRRTPSKSTVESFRGNLLAAVQQADHEFVLFIEDDDWYSPHYLQVMCERLEHADIVGESRSRYYNLATGRYHQCANRKHASLCQTGIRRSVLPWLQSLLKITDSPFVDLDLWNKAPSRFRRWLASASHFCVGMKGFPGKGGIGIGHRLDARHQADVAGRVLREWVGHEDALYYGSHFGADRQVEQPSIDCGLDRSVGANVFSVLCQPEWQEAEWLVLGKGPSFSNIHAKPRIDSPLFCLNHAVAGLQHVTHDVDCIDVEVLEECGAAIDLRAQYLVMPWRPHRRFVSASDTLADLVSQIPLLRSLSEDGRLLWYDLARGDSPITGPFDVLARYFSSEAAIGILAQAGVKSILTAGIDGGTDYAREFTSLTPLTNGRASFDDQFDCIEAIVDQYALDLKPLASA